MARMARTAIGTTTAMAIVPPVDNPLLPLAGTAVELEDAEEDVEEEEVVAEDDVEVVEGDVGTNVLVDV
jgi:hypothetical protein